MKKLLLVTLLLATYIVAKAQNWQTVRSGAVNYFTAGKHRSYQGHFYYPSQKPPMIDSPMLRVMFITGSFGSGPDSVFQFFTSLRDSANLATRSNQHCTDSLAASWLGPRMVRQVNGIEYYFNSYGDTITIQTKAAAGAFWVLAKDTAGREFIGTITQSGAMVIDGAVDSIKTISIQAYAGSTPVSHPYNNKVLQLSKEHGWLKALDFYRFPNTIWDRRETGIAIDSTQHVRLPASFQEGRKSQDIVWKYKPGNEWIWVHEMDFTSKPDRKPTFTTIRHDSVAAFQLIGAGKGLATLRSTEYKGYHRFDPLNYGGYIDSSTVTATIHTDTVQDIPSGKFTGIENSWRASIASRYYVWPYDSIRFFLTRADLFYFYPQVQNGCLRLLIPISAPDDYSSFGTGLSDFGSTGNFVQQIAAPAFFREEFGRFVFIKAGVDSFGERVNVHKLDAGSIRTAMPMLSVYPNPADDQLIIASESDLQNLQVELRNITGQIVSWQRFTGKKFAFPTANIPSGLYFLEVTGKSIRQTFKVLIQH